MMIWLKERLRQRNSDRPSGILLLMTLPMYVPRKVLIVVGHLEYMYLPPPPHPLSLPTYATSVHPATGIDPVNHVCN